MSEGIREEIELISHLTPLVGRDDALNMVNNYKREVIEEFVEKLKKEVPNLGYHFYVDEDICNLIDKVKWDEVK